MLIKTVEPILVPKPNYTPKPVKQRIVLWSFLVMVFALIANVVLLTILNGVGGSETWIWLSLALSTVFVLAIIALIASLIIRLIERAGRKAVRRAETRETFE